MLSSFYRNSPYGPLVTNYVIVQTSGYVVIFAEINHDARVIPLDGRPHSGPSVRQWLGDSRGRWDGDTLVVETTNFTDKTNFQGADENMRLIERFTRTGPGTILYRFTVDDPTAFTKPWTAEFPYTASTDPIIDFSVQGGGGTTDWQGCSAGLAPAEKQAAAAEGGSLFSSQIIHDALKRIESERLTNRPAKVRIRVYVVEDPSAIGCLQIFDPSDVKSAGRHNSLPHLDGRGGHLFVGIKLHRLGWRLLRYRALRFAAAFRIARFRRAQIKRTVRKLRASRRAACLREIPSGQFPAPHPRESILAAIRGCRAAIATRLLSRLLLQLLRRMEQKHPCPAAALLRFQQGQPAAAPLRQRRFRIIEHQGMRMRNPQGP